MNVSRRSMFVASINPSLISLAKVERRKPSFPVIVECSQDVREVPVMVYQLGERQDVDWR